MEIGSPGFKDMIQVTKSFLPPLDEYIAHLKEIWQSGILTNTGKFEQKFTDSFKQLLDVPHLQLVANGTLALQLSINALNLKGEIITTPFSYVATVNSIIWEDCKPVFADIDPKTLCLDPNEIVNNITDKTVAILATHVYGIPCAVENIGKIARDNNLKIIYDAAHATGVKYKGKSITTYGDISTLSLHATKLLHSAEGGAVICRDREIDEKVRLLKKFGHEKYEYYYAGINAKMSELHAALGLLNLDYFDSILENRKHIYFTYTKYLTHPSISIPKFPEHTEPNYSYFPIILANEKILFKVIKELSSHEIIPRRYFYPSLNELPYLSNTSLCPISSDIAKRIICLPISYYTQEAEVKKICTLVNNSI